MNYVELKIKEWFEWEQKMRQLPNLFENTSRQISGRVNQMIPKKFHDTMTAAVKGVIQSALFGANFLPSNPVQTQLSLRQRDQLAEQLTNDYTKIASAEGAGTGLGGFKLSLIDFPALLSIKMKYLFELAHLYGYSSTLTSERLFILYVFQLAFSGYDHRLKTLNKITSWSDLEISSLQPEQIDWRKLQQEYRDSLDFRKMLQLIPGVGAVVGAWANFNLMKDLAETATRCYHKRLLQL